jgi:dynein heavy chain
LDEFEAKLKFFTSIEIKVDKWEAQHQISALMLQTTSLARSLKEFANKWKESFAKELHKEAFTKLEDVSEMVKLTRKKLLREVKQDIDALADVMHTLEEVRAKQSEIELEFYPIEHMYRILDEHLPLNMVEKDEADTRAMLRKKLGRLGGRERE